MNATCVVRNVTVVFRTGAVGSPSELVGGWCPGHVLMASGSCDWCPGHVLMVSRSCFDGVPVM